MIDVERSRRARRLVLHEPDVARSLLRRLQLAHLVARHAERPVWALFMFVNGFITIALLAGECYLSTESWELHILPKAS